MKVLNLFFLLALIIACSCSKDNPKPDNTITDIEGNVYKIVVIGNQTWMAENLATTKFNDGSPITLVTDNLEWVSYDFPGYCWYDNLEKPYKDLYGALYNWYAIETSKLCPDGWHIPSQAEWDTLFATLGGQDVAGGKLKEADGTLWREPNEEATNESGFTALPGGVRSYFDGGYFGGEGRMGYFWISSQSVDQSPVVRIFYKAGPIGLIDITYLPIKSGLSVRCIKD